MTHNPLGHMSGRVFCLGRTQSADTATPEALAAPRIPGPYMPITTGWGRVGGLGFARWARLEMSLSHLV